MIKRILAVTSILTWCFFSPLLSQDTVPVALLPVFNGESSPEDQQNMLAKMKEACAGAGGISLTDVSTKFVDVIKNGVSGKDDALLFGELKEMQDGYLVIVESSAVPIETPTDISDDKSPAQIDGKNYSLTVYLYSVKDRSFVYMTSEENIPSSDIIALSGLLVKRACLFITGILPNPGPISFTESSEKDELMIQGTPDVAGDSYEIQRSLHPGGPFETISRGEDPVYKDTDISPGTVYFYRMRGYRGDIPGDFSEVIMAYKKMPQPAGENLKKLLKAKKNEIPVVRDPEQQQLEQKYSELLSTFYIKPFYVGFILNILQHYIKTYDLAILRGTGDYIIDRTNRIIYIVDPNNYIIKFYSKRLFRLYDKIPETATPEIISFGKKGNAGDRLIKGWAQEAENYVWNQGDYAEIRIPFKKYPSGTDVSFYFAGARICDPDSIQRAVISINGVYLTEFNVQRNGRYRVIIPSDFPVEEGEVTMSIQLPNAYMAGGIGNKMVPRLAIALEQITLSEYCEERDLFKRLMKQAVLFCVIRGEKEFLCDDGTRKMLPLYEAMGVATEYYKDLKDWKKYALLFDSSDKEIRDKIKEERQKLGK